MERVKKADSEAPESSSARRPTPPTSRSPLPSGIDGSPAMLAQRLHLGSLFGSAVQLHSLNDELSEDALQPAQRTTAGPESRTAPVQRVWVNGPSSFASSTPVIQAVTIKSVQNPGVKSSFNSSAVTAIIEEVANIVGAAESAKGKRFSEGHDLERLEGLLDTKSVKKTFPKDSRGTFGLGGSSYFPGVTFTTAQGSDKFVSAVDMEVDGPVKSLGERPTGTHDEVHQINAYPGLQSLLSTQGHCLFCYGLIHMRGYEHGTIREDPWPQMWTHDYKGFTLRVVGDKSMYEFPHDPIIEIKTTKWGARKYRITDK